VGKFTDHYMVRKELGSGAFGSVKLGQHRKSGITCAIKIIRKSSLLVANVYQELSKNEFQVLEETVHPYITRVFELMEDNRCYYIIMELITGGNLFDMIKTERQFSET
jgi:serine/threonine protein kinase